MNDSNELKDGVFRAIEGLRQELEQRPPAELDGVERLILWAGRATNAADHAPREFDYLLKEYQLIATPPVVAGMALVISLLATTYVEDEDTYTGATAKKMLPDILAGVAVLLDMSNEYYMQKRGIK